MNLFCESQSLMCFHYTIGLKSGNRESNSRQSAYKAYLLPLNYSPLSRSSRLAFVFIVPCLTLIRFINHPRPPSSHSVNYFQRISKASRILQSLNFSYLLWIKFFVGSITLQDFKPTTSGFCWIFLLSAIYSATYTEKPDHFSYSPYVFIYRVRLSGSVSSSPATSIHPRLIVGSGRSRLFLPYPFSRERRYGSRSFLRDFHSPPIIGETTRAVRWLLTAFRYVVKGFMPINEK